MFYFRLIVFLFLSSIPYCYDLVFLKYCYEALLVVTVFFGSIFAIAVGRNDKSAIVILKNKPVAPSKIVTLFCVIFGCIFAHQYSKFWVEGFLIFYGILLFYFVDKKKEIG